jgi:hypothetical protein
MKSSRSFIVLIVFFVCLCLAFLTVAIIYFRNQPPSSLSNSGYYVRGSTIYYHPGFGIGEPFKLPDVDRTSFVVLDERYAKDVTRVFYNGSPIPGADSATFELLASPFSRDANHIYASGTIFSDDPENFEILDENLSRDSQHIYWSDKIISDDPSHLEMMGSWDYYTYIKDSKSVFVNGGVITAADPATFEVISDAYSRDASHVFYFNVAISNADSVTFEIVESPYAKDSTQVYWMANLISGADPVTFRVLNANFECSADVQSAYYQDQLISNFDPNSIPANSQVTNCDVNGMYFSP